MKYLPFLERVTKCLADGHGVDTLIPTLRPDERRYLTNNATTLPLLGGVELFVQILSEQLGGDKTPSLARDAVIAERIKELSPKSERDIKHPAVQLFDSALVTLIRKGDGKTIEAMATAFTDKNPIDILVDVVSSKNEKAFHYLLHASPKRETYRSIIRDNLFTWTDANTENILNSREMLVDTLKILDLKEHYRLNDLVRSKQSGDINFYTAALEGFNSAIREASKNDIEIILKALNVLRANIPEQIIPIAKGENKELYHLLLKYFPLEFNTKPGERFKIIEARLLAEPEKISVEDIRNICNKDPYYKEDMFAAALERGGLMLEKLVEAFPEHLPDHLHAFPYSDNVERRERIEHILAGNKMHDAAKAELRRILDENPLPRLQPKDELPLPEYPLKNEFLPLMQTACMIEGDGFPGVQANKLSVLFGTKGNADKYLEKCAADAGTLAIHNALLFQLPGQRHRFDMATGSEWDVAAWRQFALRDGMGPRALRMLPLANEIEMAYAKTPKEVRPKGKPAPGHTQGGALQFKELSLIQLKEIARSHAYKHGEKHPELADLCIENGIGEEEFNQALKLITQKDLPPKITPDIDVDGTTLGFPGFHFRRVEPSHPWCPFIGKLVNCCNHLGGATANMARAQITNQDCSLYVLTNKEGEPIAKCTGWMSMRGNFVFNAWERLAPSYDKFCQPFLLAAALQTLENNPEVKRVTLGGNKGNASFTPITDPETPVQHINSSADANIQFEIATRERMKAIEENLKILIDNKNAVTLTPENVHVQRLAAQANTATSIA